MGEVKYLGCCIEISFSDFNLELINMLIDKKVIYESTFEEDLLELSKFENSKHLYMPVWFNEVAYNTHKDFKEEVYNNLKDYVESLDWQIPELQHAVIQCNRFLNLDERIKFLEKSYEEFYPENSYYILYNGETFDKIENNRAPLPIDFKSHVFFEIGCCPDFLESYLTYPRIKDFKTSKIAFENFIEYFRFNKSDAEFNLLIDEWIEFWKAKNTLQIIKQKIQDLKNNRELKLSNKLTLKDYIGDSNWQILLNYLQDVEVLDENSLLLKKGKVTGVTTIGIASYICWKLSKYLFHSNGKALTQIEKVSVINNSFKFSNYKKLTGKNISPHLSNFSEKQKSTFNDYSDLLDGAFSYLN